MNYASEMGSSVMMYVPGCIKIRLGVRKLLMRDTKTHRQYGDRINLLAFLRSKESRLIYKVEWWVMDKELYRMWMEEIVAKFYVLCRYLAWGTGKQCGNSVNVIGVPVEIRTGYLSNTSQMRYLFRHLRSYHLSWCFPWFYSVHSRRLHGSAKFDLFPPINNQPFLVSWVIEKITFSKKEKRQSYPYNRPWRSIRLWDVEAPTFSRQSVHRWR
jgi:hypothetical protein